MGMGLGERAAVGELIVWGWGWLCEDGVHSVGVRLIVWRWGWLPVWRVLMGEADCVGLTVWGWGWLWEGLTGGGGRDGTDYVGVGLTVWDAAG